MSEPFFPPPGARTSEAGGYREPAPAPPLATKPAVVVRPDPPAPEEDAPAGAKKPMPKLSKEEVQALIATSTPEESSAAARSGKRAIILLPIGLLRSVFMALFAEWPVVGFVLTAAIVLGALAWISAPLWKQSREGWD